MGRQVQAPARLASEDVIINAPMSYAGSAQRIFRLRRRAPDGWQLAAITFMAVLLLIVVWAIVTVWYFTWGLFLVPYRLLRRGARKRKMEALRHRELMGTIQGSAVASAAAIVGANIRSSALPIAPPVAPGTELISDADREQAMLEMREHLLAGRLTAGEFEQRVAAVQRARTHGDLVAAQADLPAPSSARSD